MEDSSFKLFRIKIHLADEGYISVNEKKTCLSLLPASLNTVFMGNFTPDN